MRVIERTLAAAFIFAVCLNFANVVGRYGFDRGFVWADEAQVFVMIWMTFLGAAAATARNIHLRMDVLIRRLPPRVQTAGAALETILVSVLCGFVAWLSLEYLMRIARLGQTSDAAGIPMWIPHSAVTAGFALIAVFVLWHGIRRLAAGTPPPERPGPERREL